MTRTCFITAGPIRWASSRIRAFWIAPYLDAQVVTIDEVLRDGKAPEADVYIWQKQASLDVIRALKDAKHVWDVCDPMWWFSPRPCEEIVEAVDLVTASNEGLAKDFRDWSAVECRVIPDRLDLKYFTAQREHQLVSPVRLIWHGLAANRVGLPAAWVNLQRLRANGYEISLTVFDDRPDVPLGYGDDIAVYHVLWTPEHELEILVSHDIALVPPYPGPWGKVKSNNRLLTSWACGLPTTTGEHYGQLANLVGSPELRQAESSAGMAEVEANWTIDRSVAEWQEVIDELA